MVAVRLRSSYMVAYFSYFMIALFILYLTEVEFISNYLAEGGSDQVCGIFSDFTEQGPTHVRIFLSVFLLMYHIMLMFCVPVPLMKNGSQ